MAQIEMARIETPQAAYAPLSAAVEGDALIQLGLQCGAAAATPDDRVAAHKWFNIAAIKGSARAAELRSELSAAMSKVEIARALREAREWMTMH